MTIIFFGSDPWFSQPVLEALVKAGHNVPVVITKGDTFGEGQRLRAKGQRGCKIIQAKTSQNISLETLRSSFSPQPLALGPSRPYAVVLASFGPPFLDDDLLDWPTYGCLNVHASLLPRWRGASPVSAAIAAGDAETGVTIMKMTKEIDRGPILGQASTKIHQPSFQRPGPVSSQGSQGQALQGQALKGLAFFDTRETLTKRLGALGGELIVDVLVRIGQIRPIGQPHDSSTPYTYRLKKEDGQIDWRKSPEEIERFIRAMSPWPSARTSIKYQVVSSKGKQEKTIKDVTILKAHLEPLTMNPLTHQLIPDLVQLPGKNPITWGQFLAGHPGAELN